MKTSKELAVALVETLMLGAETKAKILQEDNPAFTSKAQSYLDKSNAMAADMLIALIDARIGELMQKVGKP